MKALTIWQPWGSLIMIGAKPNEFRERSYFDYIGPPKVWERIVIHAGARPIKQEEVQRLLADCLDGGGHTGLITELAIPFLKRLMQAHKCRGVIPVGCGLGTAVIGQPIRADALYGGLLPHDSDRGDFNWAWPLSDVEVWEEPIRVPGGRGFWKWPTIEQTHNLRTGA